MSEDLKGSVVNGRYALHERLGSGGMATVYRARDEKQRDQVAVKVLSRDFLARAPREAERNLRRFKREAEILKLLSGSPHVVGFREHACSDTGDWFIAMELLEGEQLRYYIGRGRSVMGIPTFLHIGLHLIAGLREIHKKNIVHRDLAPDNIIVTKESSGMLYPKFLDFGIGKSLANELDQVTQLLTIMGKPQYFSPEQARGLELTFASDIYALGVILYEMLTGYVPLEIHGIPDFRKIQKDPPIPISQFKEGQRVTADCQDTIMRCLAKAPEERPNLDALEKALLEVQNLFQKGDLQDLGGITGPTVDHTMQVKLTEVELRAGDLISRYEIKSLLGRGGMGAVHLAWDPVLQREVAIKIATRVEEEKAKKALLREARASSALRCPNIVTIFDAGTEGGTPYIAMEYVDGPTLAEIIEKEGPLVGDRFRDIARGMLTGLRFAHEQPNPVIHRDLKPANILVSRQGVKITDFGIARIAEGRTAAAAASGETLNAPAGAGEGTTATMSPEQANGKTADHRSDIYSLGCVFYMMATGRGPFQGNPIAILYQHCTSKPDAPSKHNPGLEPRGLDGLILKCLEKEPEERFQNIAEIEAALALVFPDQTAAHIPWFRTKSGRIAAAVAALLVAGLSWAVFFNRPAPPPEIAFSLDNIGTSLPEGRFDPARPGPYFLSQPELPLWAQAPAESTLTVTLTPEGEGTPVNETILATPAGLATKRIPLPVAAGTLSATWKVKVAPRAGDPVEFTVAYDGRDPRVEVKTPYDSDWRRAEGVVAVLRKEELRFRLVDEESGFETPEGPKSTLELQPGGSVGSGAAISWQSEDELSIKSFDRAGRGGLATVAVRLETPRARALQPIVRTSGSDPVVEVEIVSDRLELARAPLRTGLMIQLAGSDTPSPLLPIEGGKNYTASLRLPPQAQPGVRRLEAQITLDGRAVVLGEGGLVILQDTLPPQISLEVASRGAIPALTLTSGDPPLAEPLVLNQGESLGSLFRLAASDGDETFEPEAKLEIRYGDLAPHLVAIPARGSTVGLPENGLPDAQTPFPVRIAVTDAAGNRSELRFVLERRGVQLQAITANQVGLVDGELFVRSAKQVRIATTALNLGEAEALWLEVRDGTTPLGQRLAMTRSGQQFTVVIPDLQDRDLGLASREVDFFPSETGGTPLTGSLRLNLDAHPPKVEIKALGSIPVSEGGLELGRFPELSFRIEDASGAADSPVAITTDPPNLPLPPQRLERDEGSGGRAVTIVVRPPPGDAAAATYTLKLAAKDRAGNDAPPRTVRVVVKPPSIALQKLGNTPVTARRQFVDIPFTGSSRSPLVEVRNAAGAGRFSLVATILSEGSTEPEERTIEGELSGSSPLAFVLDNLPGKRGTVALSHRELLDQVLADAVVFDRFVYFIDADPPKVSVEVGGRPIVMDEQALANEGLRVASLDQVQFRILDEGGFPESALTAENPLPAHTMARKAGEIAISLKAEAAWQSKDVRFEVVDIAGNKHRFSVRILKAKDRPEVRGLTDQEGRPLVSVGRDQWGTRGNVVQLDLRNDAPSVVGVKARVIAPGKAQTEVLLEPAEQGKSFRGKLDLPGEGLFEIDLISVTSAGASAEPFERRSVLVDAKGPTIAPVGTSPFEVGSTSAVSIRITDPSTVARAEAVFGNARLSLDGQSPEIWRLPTALMAAGQGGPVDIEAQDTLGNTTRTTIEVRVKAAPVVVRPDPPPVTPTPAAVFDAAAIRARTGLEPMPISPDWRNPSASPEFYLSKTEVSYSQFQRFTSEYQADPSAFEARVRETMSGAERAVLRRALSDLSAKVEESITYNAGSSAEPDHPVRYIVGDLAAVYCFWAGGRLPTPEEWRNAAGLYVDANAQWPIYLDGGTPKSGANYFSTRPNWAVFGTTRGESPFRSVNSLEGGSPFGLLGMAGNVSEWVLFRSGTGTLGGSFKYKHDLSGRGAELGASRNPNREGTNPREIGDVGIRVAWSK